MRVQVFANPNIAVHDSVMSCSPYRARLSVTPIPTTGSLMWNIGWPGTPITVSRPGYYQAVYTDTNGCKGSDFTNLIDPPNPADFPEGCMRICDTMLPLTVPMSRMYDNWRLYKNSVSVGSGVGTPTFVISAAGTYRMDLTIGGCTITTGDLLA